MKSLSLKSNKFMTAVHYLLLIFSYVITRSPERVIGQAYPGNPVRYALVIYFSLDTPNESGYDTVGEWLLEV